MSQIQLQLYEVQHSLQPGSPLALLRPVETVTLLYLALTNILFIAFHKNLPAWGYHVATHTAAIVTTLVLALVLPASSNRLVRFVRLWSPLPTFIGSFEEIGRIVHVVFPGWFDSILIRADYTLLSVHPTLWLEQYTSIWLNEYMQFAYTSYFFLLPILGGVLYYRGQWREFDTVMLSTAMAYYICYLTFLLFPIEGPYHTFGSLQKVELHGWYFTALINWIEGFGRVHGGAFPSAHVAGSTVVLICAYKFARRLFWVLLPVILSLFVATVYGRYHYVSDVLAGFVVGSLGVYWGFRVSSFKFKCHRHLRPETRNPIYDAK